MSMVCRKRRRSPPTPHFRNIVYFDTIGTLLLALVSLSTHTRFTLARREQLRSYYFYPDLRPVQMGNVGAPNRLESLLGKPVALYNGIEEKEKQKASSMNSMNGIIQIRIPSQSNIFNERSRGKGNEQIKSSGEQPKPSPSLKTNMKNGNIRCSQMNHKTRERRLKKSKKKKKKVDNEGAYKLSEKRRKRKSSKYICKDEAMEPTTISTIQTPIPTMRPTPPLPIDDRPIPTLRPTTRPTKTSLNQTTTVTTPPSVRPTPQSRTSLPSAETISPTEVSTIIQSTTVPTLLIPTSLPSMLQIQRTPTGQPSVASESATQLLVTNLSIPPTMPTIQATTKSPFLFSKSQPAPTIISSQPAISGPTSAPQLLTVPSPPSPVISTKSNQPYTSLVPTNDDSMRPSSIQTQPETFSPTIRLQQGQSIEISPFWVVYTNAREDGRSLKILPKLLPTPRDITITAEVTMNYLVTSLKAQYGVDSIHSFVPSLVDVRNEVPWSLAYGPKIFLNETIGPEFQSREEVDAFVLVAFSEPSVQILVENLQRMLEPENPFKTTEAIGLTPYSINNQAPVLLELLDSVAPSSWMKKAPTGISLDDIVPAPPQVESVDNVTSEASSIVNEPAISIPPMLFSSEPTFEPSKLAITSPSIRPVQLNSSEAPSRYAIEAVVIASSNRPTFVSNASQVPTIISTLGTPALLSNVTSQQPTYINLTSATPSNVPFRDPTDPVVSLSEAPVFLSAPIAVPTPTIPVRTTQLPSADAAHNGVDVSSTTFLIEYVVSQRRSLQKNYDTDAAPFVLTVEITMQYLKAFLIESFNSAYGVSDLKFDGMGIDYQTEPILSISYVVNVTIDESSAVIPTHSEFDSLVQMAFLEPQVFDLLDQLKELPAEIPFHATQSIQFVDSSSILIGHNETEAQEPVDQGLSVAFIGALSATLTALLFALCYLLVLRKRQSRDRKERVQQSCDDECSKVEGTPGRMLLDNCSESLNEIGLSRCSTDEPNTSYEGSSTLSIASDGMTISSTHVAET